MRHTRPCRQAIVGRISGHIQHQHGCNLNVDSRCFRYRHDMIMHNQTGARRQDWSWPPGHKTKQQSPTAASINPSNFFPISDHLKFQQNASSFYFYLRFCYFANSSCSKISAAPCTYCAQYSCPRPLFFRPSRPFSVLKSKPNNLVQ